MRDTVRRSSHTADGHVRRTSASRNAVAETPGQRFSREATVTPAAGGGGHGPSMSRDEKGPWPSNARARTGHEEGQAGPSGGTVYGVPPPPALLTAVRGTPNRDRLRDAAHQK